MTIVDLGSLKVSCQKCSLAELCLPRGLSRSDLEALDAIVRQPRSVQRGEYLFRAGEPLQSLLAIRSGGAKLVMTSNSGGEQILGFYLPGEVIGFDGIGTGQHTCSALALETSSVCTVPFSRLSEVSRQVPALHDQVLRLIGREMTIENELLLSISQRSADERIATFLLSLSNRLRRLGYAAREFRLSMTRREIGNYLGLTIETVSRVFGRMQKQKLIASQGRMVQLLEPGALHDISHGVTTAPPASQTAARRA